MGGFFFYYAQIKLHSWPLTFEDPWPLEWWAALALLGLQEGQEVLAPLGIQVLVDHQGTEACLENLETQVPEVLNMKLVRLYWWEHKDHSINSSSVVRGDDLIIIIVLKYEII